MQDDKIGKKCQKCGRKDYIPYQCKKCFMLCDDDYWKHGCVTDQYNPPKYQGKTQQKQYRCKVETCKKKLFTVNHYFCQKCEKLLCLAHRMPENHNCSSLKDDSCQLI